MDYNPFYNRQFMAIYNEIEKDILQNRRDIKILNDLVRRNYDTLRDSLGALAERAGVSNGCDDGDCIEQKKSSCLGCL